MGKSYAQVLIERGREEGREETAVATRQETLLRLLAKKFGELPRSVSARIQATDDTDQLDIWLEGVVTADTLADVGISAR